jgi:hypothetical protein
MSDAERPYPTRLPFSKLGPLQKLYRIMDASS